MKRFKTRALKFIAVFLALNILIECALPTMIFALTSGPKSPEFMTFTPVATTNMVDLATGDFNYNIPVFEIPGAEGGGYALSLAYNSAINSEQEASWVGFGWNLNPGAIDRNVRGFPDDSYGDPIKFYSKARPNWTMSKTNHIGLEIFSSDIGFSANESLRFNNHYGFMKSTGLGLSFKGVGLNMNMDPNGNTYSASINPFAMVASPHDAAAWHLHKTAMDCEKMGYADAAKTLESESKNEEKKAGKIKSWGSAASLAGGKYGIFTYADVNRATRFRPYIGFNVNVDASLGIRLTTVPVGGNPGFSANFNVQFNQYSDVAQAYGFMYNPTGSDTHPMMDYYVEKGDDINKRDFFIGMPFNNADIFSVSGEGVSGGFRAFKKEIGNSKPENVGKEGYVAVQNYGIEVSGFANFGLGLNLGAGSQKTKLNNWQDDYNPTDNGFIFRFNNDLAGKITYGSTNNDLVSADLGYISSIPGAKSVYLDEGKIFQNLKLNNGSEASSYIGYHTFNNAVNPDIKDYETNLGVGSKSIAEFSVCNQNGDTYNYGLPVLTRNETNLSFDIVPGAHQIIDNYLAFRKIPLMQNAADGNYGITDINSSEYKAISGEIHNKPYANTYLLTQITKPNYVDVNSNGIADEADFGGWTKFGYRQVYGGKSPNWYRYRTPYKGLLYKQNSISDLKDDIGSVITGEKEVYYLETIETKTHIAFFVTNKYKHNKDKYPTYNVPDGSGKDRRDGLGASHLTQTDDVDANSTAANTTNDQIEYLEKIILFSKARPEKPIKVINFDYDYSLVPNLPNNANASFDYANPTTTVNDKTGKLTLRRVWFEYEGTSPAKISPYEFHYEYKKSNNFITGREYFKEFDNLSDGPGSVQNPTYSPELLDPWGNMMPYGKERKKYDVPWIYQGNMPTYHNDLIDTWRKDIKPDNFDPAAWQLKYIKLPSGGEIHIQYEQKDYMYVQDQPVMAMASLIAADDGGNSYYDVNPDDLGCDPGAPDYFNQLNELATKIKQYFDETIQPDKPGGYAHKVYFKFLYDLLGRAPGLDNSNSEYITGYAGFSDAKVISNGNNDYRLRIFLDPKNSTSVPRQAAYDFLINQRQGTLQKDRYFGAVDYNGEFDDKVTSIANGNVSDVLSVIWNIVQVLGGESPGAFHNHKLNDVCKAISPALSFLKLPMYRAKKGGGVRVKRLLLYDSGLDAANGDAQVLGQQFHYVLEDGVTSSGVATNEPSIAREENPMVKYMIRKEQDFFSRITAGEDKKQTEGPLGESLLPSAAVYHSRVVVENINSSKSRSGFTVHEFFTTHDYPFDMYYGALPNPDRKSDISGFGVEATTLNSKDDLVSVPISVFTMNSSKAWMAQGFRFILNAMNGLAKRVTAYGGRYVKPSPNSGKDIDQGYLVSMQQYEYFEPGEKIKLLKPNDGGLGYTETMDTPGEETDIAFEKKQIEDNEFDINVEVDIDAGMAGIIPLPFGSASPHLGISNDLFAVHAITKVIRYPAILKSETNYRDGMISKTEYLAFNASTGQPLITKTYDGYYNLGLSNGSTDHTKIGEVYQFSVPAEWKYTQMGQKSKDESNTNQLSEQTMTITTYGVPPVSGWLSGDAINNVLDVNVKTFENNWESSWNDSKVKSDYGISDDAIIGLKKVWRPKASFIYKADKEGTDYVSTPGKPIYASGYYTLPHMFDWNGTSTQPNWIKLSEVKKYSPNGNPLEEIDVMNIPSAVIYGSQYGNNLPVMVAQNAEYNDIFFNDFEGSSEDATSALAHSGRQSILYHDNMQIVGNCYVSKHLKNKGGLLKLWTAVEPWTTTPVDLKALENNTILPLVKVASSGKWTLYEVKIDANNFPAINEPFDISLTGYSGAGSLYIDDVRFQPLDAQATCFVYDKQTFKLLTQFDDQHFGAYYKYNDEGVLTHKIVETERGLKTIQETQYNIPKIIRSSPFDR